MLLDGADRPHQHRPRADPLGDLGGGQVLQPPRLTGVATGAHAVTLPARASDVQNDRVTTEATLRPEAPQTPAPGNVAAPAQNSPPIGVV